MKPKIFFHTVFNQQWREWVARIEGYSAVGIGATKEKAERAALWNNGLAIS